jgi:hypothetical protein
MGPDGFTINAVVLVACYAVGASLVLALFRGREPQGDAVVADEVGAARAFAPE